MIDIRPPILLGIVHNARIVFMKSNRVVQLPLPRLYPAVTQVVGPSVAALTMDWQQTLNDRTGWMLSRFVEQLFRIAGSPPDILPESKAIPVESNLILLRQCAGKEF